MKAPGENDSIYKTWRSENSLVTAWLLNSIESSIAKPHMFLNIAKEVWDSMSETYSNLENSSPIFDLKTQLWQPKQGNHDVISYYNEMVALQQELDQCYDDTWENANDCVRYMEREKNDRVYMLLASVNQALDEVTERILRRKQLASIREIFSEIRQEERMILCSSCSFARKGKVSVIWKGKLSGGELSENQFSPESSCSFPRTGKVSSFLCAKSSCS